VEVLLIERQQVTNYLQKRQVAISDKMKATKQAVLATHQRDIADAESQVKTCQINVSNEEQNFEDAQKQFDPVKQEYDQFMAAQPLLTNAVYVKIKKDLNFRTGLIPSQQQAIQILQQETQKSSHPSGSTPVFNGRYGWQNVPNDDTVRAALYQANHIYLANAKKDLANTYAQIDADQQALAKMENGVDEFQANKLHNAESLLDTAKSRLTQTQSRLDTAKSHLENIKNGSPLAPNSPTLDDYFYDFTPTVVKKANTDADGNFSLTYPCNKSLTIFARAERATLSEHEKYIWLIDAPTKAEAGLVLLNNNNLIEVDPDGYFKTILKKN
jgi:hypothetical protein